MFTLFNKRTDKPYSNELQLQQELALSISDLTYAKQVADMFNAQGIPAEILKPTCRFGPNLRLTMNGITVVARTVKSSTALDVKDIRPYFSLIDVYKSKGTHDLPNPISPSPYIITNIGYTKETNFEALNRGLVLQFQPIVASQYV